MKMDSYLVDGRRGEGRRRRRHFCEYSDEKAIGGKKGLSGASTLESNTRAGTYRKRKGEGLVRRIPSE